jgi:hypothetical protein
VGTVNEQLPFVDYIIQPNKNNVNPTPAYGDSPLRTLREASFRLYISFGLCSFQTTTLSTALIPTIILDWDYMFNNYLV